MHAMMLRQQQQQRGRFPVMRFAFQLIHILLLVLTTTTTTAQALDAPNPAYQQIPPFDNTKSVRQDVCDRQRDFANNTLPLGQALAGLELRLFLHANQYLSLTPDGAALDPDYPGVLAVILDEIARRGEFTWRYSSAIYPHSTFPQGYTFDDLLLWSVDTYDVSVALWGETFQRKAKGVTFSDPWLDSSIILVGRHEKEPQTKFEAFLWVQPFHISVWMTILATILASGLVYSFLEWLQQTQQKGTDDDSDSETVTSSRTSFTHHTHNIVSSAMAFTGNLEFASSTLAGRLFALSLAFWALMTVSAYTANFASFLVVEHRPQPTIQSVEDAVRQQAPLCVWNTTAAANALTAMYPTAVVVPQPSDVESFLGVVRGECKAMLTSAHTWKYYATQNNVNGDCNLQWIGRTVRQMSTGFAYKSDSGTLCTSLIRDVWNLHISEMIDDGFLDDAVADYMQRVRQVDCAARASVGGSDLDNERLDMQGMAGIFLFHYAVTLVAMGIAVIGYCRSSGKKSSSKSTTREDVEHPLPARDLSVDDKLGQLRSDITGFYHNSTIGSSPNSSTNPMGNDLSVDDKINQLRAEIMAANQRQEQATESLMAQMALLCQHLDKKDMVLPKQPDKFD